MPILTPYRPEHVAMARELVREMHACDGLAPVDLDRFWFDQEFARKDPFCGEISQAPFGAILTEECVSMRNWVSRKIFGDINMMRPGVSR